MKSLIELNEQYCREVEQDREKHCKSAETAMEYMKNSTAKYHGRCVSTLYVPKMFRPLDIERFQSLLSTLYGIFDKVINRYREDAVYRKLFGFSKEEEDLILRTPLYDCKIPIARIDIFYDEETGAFKFCEFNTDGSSAMNEDRELNTALKMTAGYQKLAEEYEIDSYELFDSWVEKSLEIYRSAKNHKEKPNVAIVDFMESATNNEFEIFAKGYEKKGLRCEICEIRDLKYENGILYTKSGMPVDMIYRRAVTSDIMKHYEEVKDFIQAVKDEKVCLLGDFTTQIVHNKILYHVLHHPVTGAMLTEEERTYVKDHVPYTVTMDQDYVPMEEILNHKDNWILKPLDSYGSKGIFAGVEYDDEEKWKEIVQEHARKDYLVQEFCTPYQTANIDFTKGSDAPFIQISNLTGLFVYGGEFKGIYSRVSRVQIISTQYSEIALPSIVISEKK